MSEYAFVQEQIFFLKHSFDILLKKIQKFIISVVVIVLFDIYCKSCKNVVLFPFVLNIYSTKRFSYGNLSDTTGDCHTCDLLYFFFS